MYDDENDDRAGGQTLRTGVGFDRIQALIATRRYEDAEKEIRRQLAQEPGSANLHMMLSFVLSSQDKYVEATTAAETAIGLDPEVPGAHHARALALHHRDRSDEALAANAEALRLDPYDAGYHGLRAAIHLDKRDWTRALEAADHGLSLDPDHDGCRNIRAIALRQLGRRDEAEATIRDQLRQTPDDAFTHANQGWSELHRGNYRQAQEHFREALRLDPTLDYAREGILEALKAKNPVYRGLLRWKLWMNTLSGKAQWAVIIGFYVLYRVVRDFARNNPQAAPFLYPVMGLYIGFVLMTWIGDPVFDSLLRLNRFGRLALTDDRRRASNLLLGAVALLGVSALVVTATGEWAWLAPVALAAIVLLPASKIWAVSPGWPRHVLVAYVLTLAATGAAAGCLFAMEGGFVEGRAVSPLVAVLFTLFAVGQFGAWILANALGDVRPKR